MKAKDIKELIDFIASSGLDEVNIETDELKLHVKRQSEAAKQGNGSANSAAFPAATAEINQGQNSTPATATKASESTSQSSALPAAESDQYLTIKSPMIGTFYRSPNPESDPFISVGDIVEKGKVVGIIEAMKLFNEIETEVSGKIVKVLVENASPVEYDQPLFLVDPS